MRRSKAKFYILGLVVPFLISGCAGNGKNQAELLPIPEVRESFAEESNKLRSRTFDNVRFDEAYFSFTEANEFYSLKYQNLKTDFSQSPDEAYDYMCKQVDKLFPELYNDEQKAYEIRFDVILEDDEISLPDNIDPKNEEEVKKWLNERSKNAHYKYPTLEQYKKDYSEETTNPALSISNQNCYITMRDGVMWAYEKGDLAKRIGSDIKLSRFDPLSQFPIVYRTENLESQKTFHLVSGDVSIAEAVKIANKCLSELELSSRKLLFKPVVQSVNVLDIGDGCFAFFFNIVEDYKQLKFNTLLKDDLCWGVSITYDSTHETDIGGDAVMYELGELTRFRLMTPFIYSDIGETNSYTSVIPLEKAAEIASNHLTDGMEFKAISVSPVYKDFSEKDSAQYTDEAPFEDRTITVIPCWRFVLQPLTGSTDRLYYIFVDMVTGEAYSTVQQMQSDVGYE